MKVFCKNCRHFKEAPYEVRLTGCWNPENMPQKHGEAYLDEQQIPGDHLAINLRNDCGAYEAKPSRGSLLQRIWEGLLGRTGERRLSTSS